MKNLATSNSLNEIELIDNKVIKRAARAIRCLPFNSQFYSDIQKNGLDAKTVFQKRNQYQLNSKKWFKSSSSVESSFRWLIIVGMLRREVDGQGLTSKVRLTPLAKQVLEKESKLIFLEPRLIDKLINGLHREWPFR